MRRKTIFFGLLLLVAVLASMFAPAPFSRTVQADERNACPGLANAYAACRANNPNPYACDHIREQLFAHGCVGSSGSGSVSGSGSASY